MKGFKQIIFCRDKYSAKQRYELKNKQKFTTDGHWSFAFEGADFLSIKVRKDSASRVFLFEIRTHNTIPWKTFTNFLTTINWKVSLTKKKRCRNAAIVLSILMKNGNDPSNFFHFSVWPFKIFEVKGGQFAKKLELGQTKKKIVIPTF